VQNGRELAVFSVQDVKSGSGGSSSSNSNGGHGSGSGPQPLNHTELNVDLPTGRHCHHITDVDCS